MQKEITKFGEESGFTLIEVIISLILITSVTVPLTVHFFSNKMAFIAEHEIVASCIAQQEHANLLYDAGSFVPLKRRTIQKTTYTIKTARSGESLLHFKTTIEVSATKVAEFQFYNSGN